MAKSKELPPTTLDELRRNLEKLRLFAMLEQLDEAVEQASSLEQGYVTFLAGLVERQVLAQTDSGVQRRIRNAGFPKLMTFDTFDWQFQRGLNVQLVKDLMNLHFIKQARPVLLLGRPGTGKSHLSTAYGILAATAGYSVRFVDVSKLLRALYATLVDGSTDRLVAKYARPDLLILDDIRSMPNKPAGVPRERPIQDVRADQTKRSSRLTSVLGATPPVQRIQGQWHCRIWAST